MTKEKDVSEERITVRLHGKELHALMEIRVKRERLYGKPTSMSRILREIIMEESAREVKTEEEVLDKIY